MKRKLLLATLLVSALVASAQSLDIVTLRYLSADQALSQLRPLLEPGAGITGTGNKLFLRTSPGNREDILRVLEVIDREPRRLLITVRQGSRSDRQASGVRLSGEINVGSSVTVSRHGRLPAGVGTLETSRSEVALRASDYDNSNAGGDDVGQQIQTVEGGRAFIQVGQSVPVAVGPATGPPRGPPAVGGVVYQDIGTGFYATPRVSGGLVTLDISSGQDRPGAIAGSADIRQFATTVSGRLGEWISLGGSTWETSEESAGAAGYSNRSGSDSRQVWLKVDELP
ncbi:MAG TPA: hypothetical protein VMB75_10920 [Rhodocyclaceae bacterium]|nr:hypothetical protein [Rhodocyclaceae bacterium]